MKLYAVSHTEYAEKSITCYVVARSVSDAALAVSGEVSMVELVTDALLVVDYGDE